MSCFDVVSDLAYDILYEVHNDTITCWQVSFVNNAIKAAKPGQPLHGVECIQDPSDDIIRVHLAVVEYNMQCRKFGSTAEDLVKLQGLAKELLHFCKMYLPNKSGQKRGWKFEKAHSILHKVREIIMFGWTENFSTQGPERCHIDFCKKLAKCTNQKDMFLCLMRQHIREGHLQYLERLYTDLADTDILPEMRNKEQSNRNEAISCELGIRYPVLQSILSGPAGNHQTLQVLQSNYKSYMMSYVTSMSIS